MIHKPVLLEESLEYLITDPDGIYFDATVGFGGHSEKILEKLGNEARLIATDKDKNAFDHCSEKFGNDKRVRLYHAGYKNINVISKIEFINGYDGIFADLGVSSFQLDNVESGFTYREDAPLDLRMDNSQGETAADVINSFAEIDLANLFFNYGEEKKSRLIARKIVEARRNMIFRTTGQLRSVIESVVPGYYSINTLSRIFQALRIYVNNEIDELKEFLVKAVALLKPGGHIVILTYHSLEDREVKERFKIDSLECVCPPGLPVCVCNKQKIVKILTKKPVLPDNSEIKNNSRARSAKLRAAEKI